ncbi:N-acetylglucosaminyl transferase component-domain-containing protein [Mycotypha africana]|uniref:N-acetylglucosaminyl transferase component-domain-containing protein n=1 Tax=Mycotypha africana TaxID=64632 RepID=UPI00230019ED|nr:N-acetylglucosaminyl transferase component-domain-containing protein [Mycotypha africana]KAI8973580.1 N-acetylglucosaminyl transferase component-domain-containing protein [Mycotypha africana]
MTSGSDAIKLFWPSHRCSPKVKEGFLIGWYNAVGVICVASVVCNIKLDELKEVLKDFCISGECMEFTHINRVCKVPPQILGLLTTANSRVKDTHLSMQTENNEPSVWVEVAFDEALVPVPTSISLNSKKINLSAYQMIFYEQPNPRRLQFLALNPLELDISPKELNMPSQKRSSRFNTKHGEEISSNLEKILEYGQFINGDNNDPTADNLSQVLIQINSSYFLEYGIQNLSNKFKHKHATARYLLLQHVKEWSRQLLDHLSHFSITNPKGFLRNYTQRMVTITFMCFLFLILALAEATLHLLNFRLPHFILNGVALKDMSTAGQQIDLRLQQLFFWPRQYMRIRKRNWANTAKTRAYYISFYNSMWLVANDIIIGIAMGTFLMTNRHIMANRIHKVLFTYTVESLQSMMLWFLESPAGLKLNHELGSFLSELFLWLIRLWTVSTEMIEPLTPRIIYTIGLSGIFGITMIISLSSDFLAFMTLHVYCFYMVAARIFNWQLLILSSLFNLFRGKKRNILRNRIDSCDYDLDQLLLGTSLFTLLTFLFPTVLIYYLTFALSRVGIIVLQVIMETVLAFFNHFPLFAIMLRIKDPQRLPGGLKFEIFNHDYFLLKHYGAFYRIRKFWTSQRSKKKAKSLKLHKSFRSSKKKSVSFVLPDDTTNNNSPKRRSTIPVKRVDTSIGAYLWMRNLPISMSAIFFQYMLLWKRLSAHYFSAYVFKCLLYGEPIKPIPKLQYPMLPSERPSLSNLWQTLKLNLLESKVKSE